VHGGRQAGVPSQPDLFFFVMQACLESLEQAMPADAKLQFQTSTRTQGKNGGHVSGTNWSNKGEFTFSFWASLYADDAANPLASRAALLAASNAIYYHLRLFGLLMHVGSNGKRSKTEAMYLLPGTDGCVWRRRHLGLGARLRRHRRLHGVVRVPRLAPPLQPFGSTRRGG